MTARQFDPEFQQLPSDIPIFPLPNALLFARGQLPLNIFEPRYMAMVNYALATPTRLIGMVQPLDHHADDNRTNDNKLNDDGNATGVSNRLCWTYCIFQESDDGRFVIALSACAGFIVFATSDAQGWISPGHMLIGRRLRMILRVDVSALDRDPLIKVMKRYFDMKGFETDWTQIENSDNHQLLATLSMICPFEVAEKQALLEAETMSHRADLLIAMMEMALHEVTGGNDARH